MFLFYRQNSAYNDFFNVLEDVGVYLLLGIILLLIIFKKHKTSYHSHWNTLLANFSYPTKDFYAALKKELLLSHIKGMETSFVSLKEAGVGSSSRLYLRVTWKNYQYDMCCAAFGNGTFLSSWLMHKQSILQMVLYRIPFLGSWLTRIFYKVTYYKIDTASMFMTYCHQAMLKVSDDITKGSGVRISDGDRKLTVEDPLNR